MLKLIVEGTFILFLQQFWLRSSMGRGQPSGKEGLTTDLVKLSLIHLPVI
jgi:hypothetical protein